VLIRTLTTFSSTGSWEQQGRNLDLGMQGCITALSAEQQRDMHRTSFKGEKAIPGLNSETTHLRGIKSHMH
jgi:hypothetical protein